MIAKNDPDAQEQSKLKPKKKRTPRVKRLCVTLPNKEWGKIYLALYREAIRIARNVELPANPRMACYDLENSKKYLRLAAYIDRVVSEQEIVSADDDIPF